jgi:hypothetical protein
MIPVEHIQVLNPRERGRQKFQQIVENIAKLAGLRLDPQVLTQLSGDRIPPPR